MFRVTKNANGPVDQNTVFLWNIEAVCNIYRDLPILYSSLSVTKHDNIS